MAFIRSRICRCKHAIAFSILPQWLLLDTERERFPFEARLSRNLCHDQWQLCFAILLRAYV